MTERRRGAQRQRKRQLAAGRGRYHGRCTVNRNSGSQPSVLLQKAETASRRVFFTFATTDIRDTASEAWLDHAGTIHRWSARRSELCPGELRSHSSNTDIFGGVR